MQTDARDYRDATQNRKKLEAHSHAMPVPHPAPSHDASMREPSSPIPMRRIPKLLFFSLELNENHFAPVVRYCVRVLRFPIPKPKKGEIVSREEVVV